MRYWSARLGADSLLIPFFGRAELRDDADVERAARAFRPLCEVAAERGVSLLYEGTLPAESIRRLAARVDSPAFGCYFDYANVVVRDMDTATELRGLGDLVRRIHLKDARVKVGDVPLGQGRVDFIESAKALDEIGYEGWIVLETQPGLPELVARDLAFARTVVPRLSGGPVDDTRQATASSSSRLSWRRAEPKTNPPPWRYAIVATRVPGGVKTRTGTPAISESFASEETAIGWGSRSPRRRARRASAPLTAPAACRRPARR